MNKINKPTENGKKQRGVTLLEYALIGGLITVAAIAFLPDIGAKVGEYMGAIKNAMK
jgi:Flp pilus assembly pilin Flp